MPPQVMHFQFNLKKDLMYEASVWVVARAGDVAARSRPQTPQKLPDLVKRRQLPSAGQRC